VGKVGTLIGGGRWGGVGDNLRTQGLQAANPMLPELLSFSQSFWNSLPVFACHF